MDQEGDFMKGIVLGVAVASLFSVSLPVAAQAPSNAPSAQQTLEDRSAFTDARIAALKAGLKLTAEQEALWPGLEKVLRDTSRARAERIAKWRMDRSAPGARANYDALASMRNRASFMINDAQDLAKIADASEPLYQSLDQAQKRRFGALMRSGSGNSSRGWRTTHQANGEAANPVVQQP